MPTSGQAPSLEHLLRQAAVNQGSHRRPAIGCIDHSLPFVCETLTPLYYAPIYQQLTSTQRLRYNQLTGLSFNELIGLFESTFSQSLAAISARADTPADLRTLLDRFVSDEAEHQELWQRLSLASAPTWYQHGERHFVRISKFTGKLLRQLVSRPRVWTAVFWLMLTLEERSLEISRRCLRLSSGQIEPTYRQMYALHRVDEVLHIQIDRLLIDTYFVCQSWPLRQANARLFQRLIGGALLKPARAARRGIAALLAEFPELRPRRAQFLSELGQVHRHPEYQQMMYSRSATPIAFSLFDRFPEFWPIQRVLLDYQPRPVRAFAH